MILATLSLVTPKTSPAWLQHDHSTHKTVSKYTSLYSNPSSWRQCTRIYQKYPMTWTFPTWKPRQANSSVLNMSLAIVSWRHVILKPVLDSSEVQEIEHIQFIETQLALQYSDLSVISQFRLRESKFRFSQGGLHMLELDYTFHCRPD